MAKEKKNADIDPILRNAVDMASAIVQAVVNNPANPLLDETLDAVHKDVGPDWSSSMQQTYEYYIVDPATWSDLEKLDNVENCTITRDLENETKGSASITSETDLSEKYVRCYLIAFQSGYTYKIPIGTHMYQAPGFDYNGKRHIVSQDGYTPLIELKESMPPVGYALRKSDQIMALAYSIAIEHMRAPLIDCDNTKTLSKNFVSDVNDTWLTFLTDLIGTAGYEFAIDALGQIFFEATKDTSALQPVYIYNDDNSSILYPEVKMQRDLYGVPNVVEVVYSPSDGTPIYARAANNNKDSIVSIKSRGREVVHRETNPEVPEGATQDDLKEYATQLLKNLSAFEYQITYTHGYCPVELGDCVELNYERAGINHVKARVIRQVIKCEPGCPVEETAVYTQQLWE